MINPLNDERDRTMIDFYTLKAKAYTDKKGEVHFYRPEDSFEEFLPFASKDEYLSWRSEWRAAYAALSVEIRALRKEWRAEGQVHDPLLSRKLEQRRDLARLLLVLRHASKAKAQALYQQERAATNAA